jgi:general L-amino acid transport system permease protein
VIVGAAPLFIRVPAEAVYGLAFLLALPLVSFLLHGGFLGLETVATSQWGGLMLTLVIAAVGIAGPAAGHPAGAGRRSGCRRSRCCA